MGAQTRLAGLAVVGVDLQRRMHPDGKTLAGRVHRLPRAVGARVADDADLVAEPAVAASRSGSAPAAECICLRSAPLTHLRAHSILARQRADWHRRRLDGACCCGYEWSQICPPVDRVGDEHDVLVPRHELPLPRGASNDEAIHAIVDLQVQAMLSLFSVEGVLALQMRCPDAWCSGYPALPADAVAVWRWQVARGI